MVSTAGQRINRTQRFYSAKGGIVSCCQAAHIETVFSTVNDLLQLFADIQSTRRIVQHAILRLKHDSSRFWGWILESHGLHVCSAQMIRAPTHGIIYVQGLDRAKRRIVSSGHVANQDAVCSAIENLLQLHAHIPRFGGIG